MSQVQALLLAAGLGTRLRPVTDSCPKCLVPIASRPLLEHWLIALHTCNISSVWVNLHHHCEMVQEFLARDCFSGWVNELIEVRLLGTAGTLGANADKFSSGTTLLIHADNWCQCDFQAFLDFHLHARPVDTVMTMMTFHTSTPESCGIVELGDDGVVIGFHEKVSNPPSKLANGAVYILEPEVVRWIGQRSHLIDFSTGVIPKFLGRIATWENCGIHRDIGNLRYLLDAQSDPQRDSPWPEDDGWVRSYKEHPVHTFLSEAAKLLS